MLKWDLGWVMGKNEPMENSEKRNMHLHLRFSDDIPFPLTLSCTIDINEMRAIFQFFIMADADIPFPSTLGKPEPQTLGGVSNLKFFIRSILTKCKSFFNFFIMADADIPFPSTLGKLETQTLGGR